MCIDIALTRMQVGFSTSLALVQRSGAPVDSFMSILRASALYAPTYDKKLQKMLDRDYGAANFPTKVRLMRYRGVGSECPAPGWGCRAVS